MSGSVNKAIIIGNLGRNPETRHAVTGDKIVNLSVATSEQWKDRTTGERRERTEWHRVVIFDQNLADVAEKYLRKGTKVYLEGRIETRQWQDRDGHDKYTTEVVLPKFGGTLTMLDSRGKDGPPAATDPDEYGQTSPPAQPAATPPADMDDDIPF